MEKYLLFKAFDRLDIFTKEVLWRREEKKDFLMESVDKREVGMKLSNKKLILKSQVMI